MNLQKKAGKPGIILRTQQAIMARKALFAASAIHASVIAVLVVCLALPIHMVLT
jgi:hypothetical protein